MNYQNHYDLLISRSKSRILEGYSEKHHIIPICMSGDNSAENLVRLTPEEHFIAHQLLVKIYPGNHKLIFAANMMAGTRPGNKQYGWLRRKHSIAISETLTGRTKETHPGVKAQSEKMLGRTKETHPSVKAMSEKRTGRTKETCPGVKAQAEKLTGRTKDTCPGVKATSEKLTGRTKENDPRVKSLAEKLTGRTKETHPGVKAMSEKKTGRTKDTCPGVKASAEKRTDRTKETHAGLKAMSEKLRILSDVQEQILFDMRESGISGKEIVEYFKKLDFHIAYSSVFTICNRVKRENINSFNMVK